MDAAEAVMYGVISGPMTTVPTSEALFDRLAEAMVHWDGEDDSVRFAEDAGTAVFYNFQQDVHRGEVAFDAFFVSGSDQRQTLGWPASTPVRVYTCYRLEMSFENGALADFRRTHDYGDQRLSCPPELVSALDGGAQYREPWIFDG